MALCAPARPAAAVTHPDGEVTSVDCTGLRPLLAAAHHLAAGGGHLVVRDPSAPLARLITCCALDEDLHG